MMRERDDVDDVLVLDEDDAERETIRRTARVPRYDGTESYLLDGAMLVLAATIFGAILPTVIAWFVVAPLKGQPPVAFVMPGVLIGPIVNAAWGLGTGLGLLWFGRPRAGSVTQTR